VTAVSAGTPETSSDAGIGAALPGERRTALAGSQASPDSIFVIWAMSK